MRAQRLWVNTLIAAVFMIGFIFSTAHAQIPGQVPDLNSWVNKWFKLTITRTPYYFADIGVKPAPATPLVKSLGIFYLKVTKWDLLTETLTAAIYGKDELGNWGPTPMATLEIRYFAGSDLKFIGSAQLATPDRVTMGLVLIFTGQRDKAGNFVLGGITKLSTTGSYMFAIDNAPGATERVAGSVKMSGSMIPESKVPPDILGP